MVAPPASSREARSQRDGELVWLPSLQVWTRPQAAAVPTAPASPLGGPVRGGEEAGAEEGATVEVIIVSSSDEEDDDDGGGDSGGDGAGGMGGRWELPSCPICLTDILDPLQKAVLNPCLHVFCQPCLQRWLGYKKDCPLCKRVAESYMHNIRSDAEYSVVAVPASPPRDRPLVDLPRARTLHARPRPAAPAASRRQLHARPQWQGAQEPERGHEPSGAGGSSGAEQQPRPYFWRVQRACRRHAVPDSGPPRPAPSPGVSGPAASSAGPPSHEAQDLTRRRAVYQEGRWAELPRAPRPGGSLLPGPGDVAQQRRIREWVTRELRALLNEEDVSFLVMYFLGLWGSHGASVAAALVGSGRRGHAGAGTAAFPPDLCAALAAFLGEHSRHFWHELTCFALSRCSVDGYDRLASYPGGQQPPREASAGPALGAPGGNPLPGGPSGRDERPMSGRTKRWRSNSSSPRAGAPWRNAALRGCDGAGRNPRGREDGRRHVAHHERHHDGHLRDRDSSRERPRDVQCSLGGRSGGHDTDTAGAARSNGTADTRLSTRAGEEGQGAGPNVEQAPREPADSPRRSRSQRKKRRSRRSRGRSSDATDDRRAHGWDDRWEMWEPGGSQAEAGDAHLRTALLA